MMSYMLKQKQQQAQETVGDNPDSMYGNNNNNNNNVQHQIKLEQSSPPSNETMTVSSIMKESQENNNFDQQIGDIDVVIPLDDCMKCFVKVLRCQVNTEIKEQASRSDMSPEPTLEQQIRERQEEEKLSPPQQQNNQQSSQQVETTNDITDDDYPSQHFMDGFICLDLPWPESQ